MANREAIRDLYRAGNSLRTVGEAVGLTPPRIRQILRAMGEPMKSRGWRPDGYVQKVGRRGGERAHVDRDDAIQAMVRDGKTYSVTARAMGVTPSVVAGVIHRYGR